MGFYGIQRKKNDDEEDGYNVESAHQGAPFQILERQKKSNKTNTHRTHAKEEDSETEEFDVGGDN